MGIPLIADGGIRGPSDLSKAIAAGASTAILGSLLAGTLESPGKVVEREGNKFKIYRGMASMGAYLSKQIADGKPDEPNVDYVPEGVEAVIPYKDEPAEQSIHRLVGGLRSGMTYSNSRTIEEFHQQARFVRQTSAGLGESRPHILER
jgi:IMP dehydrogenase